jgi:hypothetical protein
MALFRSAAFKLGFAPWASNSSTALRLSLSTASINGVMPLLPRALTFAPSASAWTMAARLSAIIADSNRTSFFPENRVSILLSTPFAQLLKTPIRISITSGRFRSFWYQFAIGLTRNTLGNLLTIFVISYGFFHWIKNVPHLSSACQAMPSSMPPALVPSPGESLAASFPIVKYNRLIPRSVLRILPGSLGAPCARSG